MSTTTPPDRPLSVTGVGKSVTGVEKGTAPEPALFTLEDIIGTSPAILELKHKVARIARLPSPILVYGETGAGKEILVQAIHSAGPRRNGPFVAQNCAALPEGLLESILFGTTRGSFTGAQDRPGLFEVADGGTLFLDEIDSMPPNLQAKLLRAVTESGARRVGDLKLRRFNIRLAAAISSHPSRAVESGALRADLYYRLSVILLAVPPLRERKEDIPALVEHFVACFNRQFGTGVRRVTPEVMEILVNHDWPGNVRELRNTIESAMALAEGDAITLDHIRPDLVAALPLRRAETPPPPAALSAPPPEPPALRAAETPAPAAAGPVTTDAGKLAAPLRVTVKDTERQLIAAALAECQGNLTRAARKLGIPRQTLQYRIKVLRKAGLI